MLLPNEWIENSIETYIYQHTTKSQIIYWGVLAAVAAAIIALPFIYVDISVQGSGVVRPVTEKTEIKSAITELVDSRSKKNYHFDLTGAFSNIIEESEAIEYDDDDDEDEFDDDDDD